MQELFVRCDDRVGYGENGAHDRTNEHCADDRLRRIGIESNGGDEHGGNELTDVDAVDGRGLHNALAYGLPRERIFTIAS